MCDFNEKREEFINPGVKKRKAPCFWHKGK